MRRNTKTMYEWRKAYRDKEELMLERGFPEVSPHEFYRDLFPEGSLQSAEHDGKGIGIDLHFPEENLYPGKCSLFEGGEICREFLDIVPFYKENKEVQKAVNYLENHFNKKEKSLMKPKKPEQAPRL